MKLIEAVVPFWGVSSVAPSSRYDAYCNFYSSTDCTGDFRGVRSTNTVLDFLNWNDNISSYLCIASPTRREVATASTIANSTDSALQVEGLQVRGSTELADRDGTIDDLCVAFWKDDDYKGETHRPCYPSNHCIKLEDLGFGVSSLKISTPYTTCYFYQDSACKSEQMIMAASGTELNELSNWLGTGQDWNDKIISHKCLKMTVDTTTLQAPPPKREVSDLSADAPSNEPTTAELQTSSNDIGLDLFQDTLFRGFYLKLSAKVNACVSITKSDGSGKNFELSSTRITTPTTTSDGQSNLAFCKLYQGKNCEEDTWVSFRAEEVSPTSGSLTHVLLLWTHYRFWFLRSSYLLNTVSISSRRFLSRNC